MVLLLLVRLLRPHPAAGIEVRVLRGRSARAATGTGLGSLMLTLSEAARNLGLSPSTLRLQIRLGKLRAMKWGRDWMIEPADLEAYRRDHLRKETA